MSNHPTFAALTPVTFLPELAAGRSPYEWPVSPMTFAYGPEVLPASLSVTPESKKVAATIATSRQSGADSSKSVALQFCLANRLRTLSKKHWLDDLYDQLEMAGYAVGSAVLPGGIIGAPHRRERIMFGAHRLDVPDSDVENWGALTGEFGQTAGGQVEEWPDVAKSWEPGRATHDVLRSLANAHGIGREGVGANGHPQGREGQDVGSHRLRCGTGIQDNNAPHYMPWGVVDWVCGGDGKWRPIEPGLATLVDGFSDIVGQGKSEILRLARSNKTIRLKGYGNAIIPALAAEFIRAFVLAIGDSRL